MLLTFSLLGAAIAAVWLPDIPLGRGGRLPPWQPLLIGSIVAGVIQGILTWPALVALAALWAAAWSAANTQRPVLTCAWLSIAGLLALLLATHRMPGFTPWSIVTDMRLSANSAPMTLKANFGKGAAGLILLACCCRRVRAPSEWPKVLAVGAVVGASTAVVVIPLVVSLGALRLEPKWSDVALAWMAVNLFLTCVMEEALFRGILQERMSRALAHRRSWRYVPIAAAGLLFGLVHFGGGPWLVLVATVAGIGYGLAYALTGRIEAAVLAHFGVNAIHFFGFTYPYAMR